MELSCLSFSLINQNLLKKETSSHQFFGYFAVQLVKEKQDKMLDFFLFKKESLFSQNNGLVYWHIQRWPLKVFCL